MRHVLRAEKGKGSREEAEEDGLEADQEMRATSGGKGKRRELPVEGGFEEQDDFIGLEHGTPTNPESESEDEGESGHSSEEDNEDETGEDEEAVLPSGYDGKLLVNPESSPPPSSPGAKDTDSDDEDGELDVVW